jgi:glutaminyl-tRNA synthetase
VEGQVRLYDRLFTEAHPDGHEGRDAFEFLNPASRELRDGVKLEPSLADLAPGERVQFERIGYFCADPERPLTFHRTVGLKDDWAKIRQRSS